MPAGRPPMYESADQLQEAISEYFQSGVKKRTVITKDGAIEIPVPTITGLCNYLGFDSRQSFYDYELKPEFAYTIKKARLLIEQEYEELLQMGQPTGAIFALKNFGWVDKVQTEHSGELKQGFTVNVITSTEPIKETEEDVSGK